MIPNLKIYLIIAAFLSSVGGSIFLTARYKDGQYAIKEKKERETYIAELEKQQNEYNAKVEMLHKNAIEQQTKLADLNSELERKYANANRRAAQELSKYNSLVSNGWRLRDPNAQGMPCMQMPGKTNGETSQPTISSDGTTCSGELSRQASEFLLNLATDADKVVGQLKTVQEYAQELRKICETQ